MDNDYKDEVRERILEYFERRNAPVSRSEIMKRAGSVGIEKNEVFMILNEMREGKEDYINIGNWWGYEQGTSVAYEGEEKDAWYLWYEMSDEEKNGLIRAFEWYENL